MKNVSVILLCSLLLGLSGCATNEPKMTPLEIQSMQSRTFEHPKDVVFRSVVSVFQDLGYTLQDADLETGLVTAESAASSNAWFRAFTGSSKVNQTRATAFIEQIGGESRVRLNFVEVEETSSSWGRDDRDDTPILDPAPYQNAFERIENAIFVRSAE